MGPFMAWTVFQKLENGEDTKEGEGWDSGRGIDSAMIC